MDTYAIYGATRGKEGLVWQKIGDITAQEGGWPAICAALEQHGAATELCELDFVQYQALSHRAMAMTQ